MPIVINGSGSVTGITTRLADAAASAGSVLQVVHSVLKTANTGTNHTSYDATGITATITPSAASSKVLVMAQVTGNTSVQKWVGLRLYRGGSVITDAISTTNTCTDYAQVDSHYANNNWIQFPYQPNDGNATSEIVTVPGIYLDSPSTTSSTTYDIRACGRESGTTWYINRPIVGTSQDHAVGGTSTLTLMEIAG